MQLADTLVLFSRYENLPCVIAEALCSGLPVVSNRIAGIPEMLDETNGIMLDADNEEQLQLALRQILMNDKDWRNEKSRGKRHLYTVS